MPLLLFKFKSTGSNFKATLTESIGLHSFNINYKTFTQLNDIALY